MKATNVPRQQINQITAFIDGSYVYSVLLLLIGLLLSVFQPAWREVS